jgi:transposase-like protein
MGKGRIAIKKKYSKYSEEFKQKVCEEYVKGNKTKEEIKTQYGIVGSTSLILYWLRKFGYIGSEISPKSEFQFMTKPRKETSKSLEKENEDLKLQLEMYKRMIEIAEKELNIPIVKKSDTK